MARNASWEMALASTMEDWRTREFAWGTADCFQFARCCAQAITDASALDNLPVYYDRAGVSAVIAHFGAQTYAGAVDAVWPRRPIMTAQRGDWVMLDADGPNPCLGVVAGRGVAFMGEQRGLVILPLNRDWIAWLV